MCLRPSRHFPRLSLALFPSGSGRATDWVEVRRPLPTPDTTPVARSASGTRRFTSVDLPTPGMPDQCGDLPGQYRGHLGEIVVAADDHRQIQIGECRGEVGRISQIRLGQTQDR